MGEAAPITLPCADVVALAPMDDSVDSNAVIIEGAGEITSFGDSQRYVLKRVKFVPLGGTIKLFNGPQLNLLSGQQRSIKNISFGMYVCNGANSWDEVYFVERG